MPDLPVMEIAHLMRLVIIFKIGARRAGPVRPRWIQRAANFRQHSVEKLQIIFPKLCRQLVLPSPVKPARLDFVITVPDHNARVIAQTLYVIDRFVSHVVEKRLIAWVEAATKHEILPNEDSHLVAEFVKIVTLVNASAPDPQHVHVGVARRFKQLAIFVFADAGRKTVGRNPVCALGKYRYAINHESEALAGPITLFP